MCDSHNLDNGISLQRGCKLSKKYFLINSEATESEPEPLLSHVVAYLRYQFIYTVTNKVYIHFVQK